MQLSAEDKKTAYDNLLAVVEQYRGTAKEHRLLQHALQIVAVHLFPPVSAPAEDDSKAKEGRSGKEAKPSKKDA